MKGGDEMILDIISIVLNLTIIILILQDKEK